MNTLHRILILLSGSSFLAMADGGLPINRKTHEVRVPHVTLTISESQTEEIDSLGTLTLSSEQWQQLRAISPNCPMRIEEILPVTYRDCDCGLAGVFFGIQLSTNRVAVTHSEIAHGSDGSNVRRAIESGKDLILRMDKRGQFYYGGALIHFEDLLKLIADTAKADRMRMLGVVRPLGVKRDSSVAKERLDALYKAAAGTGWEEWNLARD